MIGGEGHMSLAGTETVGVTKSALPRGEIHVHWLASSTDLPHIPVDVTKCGDWHCLDGMTLRWTA